MGKHSEYVRRLNISRTAPFKRNRRESPVTALNRKLSHLVGDVPDVREESYHGNLGHWRIGVRCSSLKNFEIDERSPLILS